jgi:hypothetical protein
MAEQQESIRERITLEFRDSEVHPYAETKKLGTGSCSLILAFQIWFLIAK